MEFGTGCGGGGSGACSGGCCCCCSAWKCSVCSSFAAGLAGMFWRTPDLRRLPACFSVIQSQEKDGSKPTRPMSRGPSVRAPALLCWHLPLPRLTGPLGSAERAASGRHQARLKPEDHSSGDSEWFRDSVIDLVRPRQIKSASMARQSMPARSRRVMAGEGVHDPDPSWRSSEDRLVRLRPASGISRSRKAGGWEKSATWRSKRVPPPPPSGSAPVQACPFAVDAKGLTSAILKQSSG